MQFLYSFYIFLFLEDLALTDTKKTRNTCTLLQLYFMFMEENLLLFFFADYLHLKISFFNLEVAPAIFMVRDIRRTSPRLRAITDLTVRQKQIC